MEFPTVGVGSVRRTQVSIRQQQVYHWQCKELNRKNNRNTTRKRTTQDHSLLVLSLIHCDSALPVVAIREMARR